MHTILTCDNPNTLIFLVGTIAYNEGIRIIKIDDWNW